MQRNDSGGGRWPRVLLLLAVLAYPAYLGAMWGVRVYVDSQIERMEGLPLPQFSLTGQNGEVYSTESLRGRKVVLNFFRSRCVSCRAEKEEIKALARGVGDDVLVLGVMTDAALGFAAEESEKALGFAAEESEKTLEFMDYEHPVIMADRQFMDAFHGVRWSNVTPVTYMVDPNGNIVSALRGTHSREELRAALENLD